MENHFEIIESFDEIQILNLTLQLVNEASSTEDNLIKWTKILNRNIPRMTKKFATAVALQCISNMVQDIEFCATKTIVEKTDFVSKYFVDFITKSSHSNSIYFLSQGNVLKSLDNPENLRKVLKNAKKEIAKQDYELLDVVPFDRIKRNLINLSKLPLSFLDVNVRTYLFGVLYTFEEETKNTTDFKEFCTNLYLGKNICIFIV